jgi:hypothetical protein
MSAPIGMQPPPRFTGKPEEDWPVLMKWIEDFYRYAVLESRLLDGTYQTKAAPIVPTKLPDPSSTSLANAQAVANAAYKKAFGL